MMSFRKSKKEPMTDSSSNLNLNLYEPVSIINYEKRKCNRFLQKTGARFRRRLWPAGAGRLCSRVVKERFLRWTDLGSEGS